MRPTIRRSIAGGIWNDQNSFSLGFLKQETPLTELIDRAYNPAEIKPAEIDLKRMPEIIKQDKAN